MRLSIISLVPLLLAATDVDRGKRLVEVFHEGDEAESLRIGQRESASGLLPYLKSRIRVRVAAAIEAAPGADDAWILLAPLAQLAAGPDRAIATCAARVSRNISEFIDFSYVERRDIGLDEIGERIVAWRAIGADGERYTDVRVYALEVASNLSRALTSTADAEKIQTVSEVYEPFDREALVRDHDPEIRRAALELMSTEDEPGMALVAERVVLDEDPIVVAVAGQIMCTHTESADPPPADTGADASAPAAAARAAAARSQEAIERLRALAADRSAVPRLPPAAALGVARCLAGDRESAAALAALKRLSPARTRALINRWARR